MASLNVVKTILDCLKLKYLVRQRLFWSNGRSYTGICRHTCNESFKGVSPLHVSTTLRNGSFVSLKPEHHHFVHWWRDQHNTGGASVDCISLAMVSCRVCPWLSQRVITLFCLFSLVGFTQEPQPWGCKISVACTVPQPHKHLLSLCLSFSKGCI